ncbi:transposase [Gammaproteobacteria bacterium]
MQRAYRFRFYPTATQSPLLSGYFGSARWVWNACLSWRAHLYKDQKTSVNGIDFSKELTFLKTLESYSWLKKTPSAIYQQTLRDQETAFSNFFSKRAGYPKFKRKHSAQSIRFTLDQRVILNYFRAGKLLRLTKLGSLNIRWSRIPTGIPKMVTVSKDSAGRYFVSFSCEEEIQKLPSNEVAIGIDLGITDILVTSDGWKSGNPRHLSKKLRALKKYQRRMARCQKPQKGKKVSGRYKKAALRVARYHAKVANARKDWLQKQTTEIIRRAGVIALEDLNISGMLRNRKLSRVISDVGMGELRRELEYKAQWYGRNLITIGRFEPTSKVCSDCEFQVENMGLSIRKWECPNCGTLHDRDANAAQNILALATGGRPESNARVCGRKPPSVGSEVTSEMLASANRESILRA